MSVHPMDQCHREHEPDDDDMSSARDTLGADASVDDVYGLAVKRVLARCAEEPCGAGEDPYGRTAEDWALHAE